MSNDDRAARQAGMMKLSVFLAGDSNYHMAGWRHPQATLKATHSLEPWLEFARKLEDAKVDALFVADTASVPGVDKPKVLEGSSRIDRFEPTTLLAALAGQTRNLGLIATVNTTYSQPFAVARTFASLDLISGGRSGWNLVTGGNPEDATNFSAATHAEHADRYKMAEEFADVVLGLWDSFEQDAFPRDKQSGRYLDSAKMHVLHHKGRYFSVKGPLSVAPSPQGRPVVVQAGASEPARELSARVADVMFASLSTFEDARDFYADVKGRMAKFGRAPSDLKIMPGLSIYTGRTREEADAKFDELSELVPIEVAVARLSFLVGGTDLSSYDLDGPMPEFSGNSARVSVPQALARLSRRGTLTLRQTALRAFASRAHFTLQGSAQDIVDDMQHWFRNGAADGFNLLPPTVPGGLDDIVDHIVPELRRRGLFRAEYEGRTLRDNLGLGAPVNRFAAMAPAHGAPV